MVEGMNKGFKTASESLRDLQGDHRSIMRALSDIVDVIQNDIPAEMKIVAITVIVMLIILQSGIGFWQNKTIQLQNGSVETVVRDMAQRMESMEQIMKETAAKGAKMEKQIEDMIQERRLVENNFAAAIAQAVEQTVNRAIGDARLQPSQRLQGSHADRMDRMQSGLRYLGNSVSPHPGPNAIALIGTRQ